MKPALDTYDDMPKYMRKYLQNYGWHFNKALCNYAVSLMTKNGKKLEPLTKEYVPSVHISKNINAFNIVNYIKPFLIYFYTLILYSFYIL